MRAGLACLAAGLVAAGLWLWSAQPYLADGWPVFPFVPEAMDLDGILLAHGHMPRGVVALLAGALLGLSGALLQVVLRNPIADPSTLGISAGAQLALIVATVLAPQFLIWGRWPVAMGGSALAIIIVMAIGAARTFHPVTMVITGMLIGLFASSTAAAITLSQGHYLFSLVVWTGGSLVQTSWQPATALLALVLFGACAAAFLARPLQVLNLDGAAATSLGLNVAWVRAFALLLATALAASDSATVGLVGFVGLAAPALARACGARTVSQLLFVSPVAGALLLSICDGLVLLFAGTGGEMFPTGAVTGLLGGPLLLMLLPRLRATPPPTREDALPRLRRSSPVLCGLAILALVQLAALVTIGRVPDGWMVLDADSFAQFLPNRLPRIAGAACAGGLLALAGVALQRLTANPLASPEVMGVSGGAAIGYATVLFTAAAPSAAFLMGGAAIGGAAALLVITSFVFGREPRPERVLLAGIAVSAFAAAFLSVMMAAGTAKSFAILAWLSGSTTTVTLTGATVLAVVLTGLLGLGLMLRRWLAILPLGPSVARNLGVPLGSAWIAIVVISGFATGAATITVGPLSFVGLMAPHMARRLGLASAANHTIGSVIMGAMIMMFADFGARMASFPYDLPLGLIASLIGTPWLLWLMLRKPA